MFPLVVTIGIALTVTVTVALASQDPVVTVTEYNVVITGETVMFALCCPVLHKKFDPPEAVKGTDAPSHIAVSVCANACAVKTEIVTEAVSEQLPLDTVTE